MAAVSDSDLNNVDQHSKKRKFFEDVPDESHSSRNGTDKSEEDYFLSYADIELHRTMIEDQVRTSTYRDAIFNNKEEWVEGKVVADVGCGTGILSMFCAQAGAKKVYAIEASEIADQAAKVIQANGYSDVIVVLRGKAEEIELPEQVDVIVSEWMGYMLFYETMLPSVLHIRDRWLKPGGKMYPERAALYMALSEASWLTKYVENTYDFWISLNHEYSLDMSLLADEAVRKYKEVVHVHMVSQADVASLPNTICDLDLYTVKAKDLNTISDTFFFSSMGSRDLNSLVLWFDVWFPGGLRLSTSPDDEDTHWQNTVLPIDEAHLKQDTQVAGQLDISPSNANRRCLKICLKYRIGNRDTISKVFNMDENCSE